MIVALDTVFGQCSVALVQHTAEVIDTTTQLGNRQQTQQILPMIQAIFAKNNLYWQDITAIAFNRGPGAFSGIRINTAVAQALSFAHDLPCLPVSSLQALAQLALAKQNVTHVNAVMDARMNQVYFGEYHAQPITIDNLQSYLPHLMVLACEETLLDYGQIPPNNLPLFGDGAGLLNATNLADKMAIRNSEQNPTAEIIGQIGAYLLATGQAVSAENALPVYLRHNAWKTIAEQAWARQNNTKPNK